MWMIHHGKENIFFFGVGPKEIGLGGGGGGNQFSYSYPLTSKDDMDSKDDTKYKHEYSNTTSLGANVNSVYVANRCFLPFPRMRV